jgi:hypothetical protein
MNVCLLIVSGLLSAWRSDSEAVVLAERGEYPGRQLRRTPAIDELEQLVQVDPVRTRQSLCEIGREPGAA